MAKSVASEGKREKETQRETRERRGSSYDEFYSFTESIRESLCARMSSKRSQDSKKVHVMPSSPGQEPSLDSETDPLPPTEKPPLSASVARRMIGHALGVRINASPEQREKESKLLKEAKGMCLCMLPHLH